MSYLIRHLLDVTIKKNMAMILMNGQFKSAEDWIYNDYKLYIWNVNAKLLDAISNTYTWYHSHFRGCTVELWSLYPSFELIISKCSLQRIIITTLLLDSPFHLVYVINFLGNLITENKRWLQIWRLNKGIGNNILNYWHPNICDPFGKSDEMTIE